MQRKSKVVEFNSGVGDYVEPFEDSQGGRDWKFFLCGEFVEDLLKIQPERIRVTVSDSPFVGACQATKMREGFMVDDTYHFGYTALRKFTGDIKKGDVCYFRIQATKAKVDEIFQI